jgi:hypothetical protein
MTGSRPTRDGRATPVPAMSSDSSHSAGPPHDAQEAAHPSGRHRRRELGTSGVPVTVFTARHLLVPSSGGDPAHGIKVYAAEVGIHRSAATAGRSPATPGRSAVSRTLGFDGHEVYAAGSLARRSARDTIVRLYACADRVRLAAQTVVPGSAGPGEVSTGAEAIAEAAAHRLHAIERAERRLIEALDALDAARVVVGDADRELRRFHPHGGSLVVTFPTRKRALDRLDRATSAASTCYYLADNAVYSLVKEIVAGERAVRAVDHLVGYLLDCGSSAATAPPPFLRLVRRALPPSQQLDWWRELCSLFAECEPEERRAQATSHGLNALRTIWTAWTVARNPTVVPRTEEVHRTRLPPDGPGAPPA